MKHLSAIALAFFCLLFLAACNSGPQKAGPTPTAKAFLDALRSGDYDSAKEFCTPDSRDKLKWFESMSSMGANPYNEPYEIVREELSGDYARVFYTQDGDGKEKVLKLRNTTGKWEVIASKNDLSANEESAGDLEDGLDDAAEEFSEGMEELGKGLEELGEGLENGFDIDSSDEEEEAATASKFKADRAGKSPAEIATGFLTALKYNDYDGAKKYASARTADVLDMKSGMGGDKAFGEFEIGETDLEGEYATVHYTDQDGKDKTIKLGKDAEGNWEVIMTKSDFNSIEE